MRLISFVVAGIGEHPRVFGRLMIWNFDDGGCGASGDTSSFPRSELTIGEDEEISL